MKHIPQWETGKGNFLIGWVHITALCTVYCNHAEKCTVQYIITEARWLVTSLIPSLGSVLSHVLSARAGGALCACQARNVGSGARSAQGQQLLLLLPGGGLSSCPAPVILASFVKNLSDQFNFNLLRHCNLGMM